MIIYDDNMIDSNEHIIILFINKNNIMININKNEAILKYLKTDIMN